MTNFKKNRRIFEDQRLSLTTRCSYSLNPFLKNKRCIGRLLAFFHLLSSHRRNSLSFFLEIFNFLTTGESSKLGYKYKNNLLIELYSKDSGGIFDEIFKKRIYDLDFSKDNPTIVDIGANEGLSALFFLKKFPKAKIYCYEPNPFLLDCFHKNLNHNLSPTDKRKICLINKAVVGDDRRKRDFYFDEDSVCEGSLYSSYAKGLKRQKTIKINVKTIGLARIVEENKEIDILKIDAEGAEYELLSTIMKYEKGIHSIVMEIHRVPGKDPFSFLAELNKKYFLAITDVKINNTSGFLADPFKNPVDVNEFCISGLNRSYFRCNKSL